jgi:hypothetical protein
MPEYRRVSYSLHSASYGIQCPMFEVKRTDAFDSWLKGLADAKNRASRSDDGSQIEAT